MSTFFKIPDGISGGGRAAEAIPNEEQHKFREVVEKIWDNDEKLKFEEDLVPICNSTYVLNWMLNEYMDALEDCANSLDREEGQTYAKGHFLLV